MSVSQAAQRRSWTSDVAENFTHMSFLFRHHDSGRYVSCTERTVQQNDFELILSVKIKTRHPVEGSFGSEFPAMCNYFVVMAA